MYYILNLLFLKLLSGLSLLNGRIPNWKLVIFFQQNERCTHRYQKTKINGHLCQCINVLQSHMFSWKFKHKITFKTLAMWSAPCHVRLHPVKFTVLRVIEFFIPWQITKRKKKKKTIHTIRWRAYSFVNLDLFAFLESIGGL